METKKINRFGPTQMQTLSEWEKQALKKKILENFYYYKKAKQQERKEKKKK